MYILTMEPESQSYIDSHTHLLDFSEENLQFVLKNSFDSHLSHIIANTTSSIQYKSMINLFNEQYGKKLKVIPAFGIHPCYVYLQKERKNEDYIKQIK